MKHITVCFSLLSLVTFVTAKRPDLLVSRHFLSNYLPVHHETALVLSAVNIGSEIAHDVTLSLNRQLYSNTSSTSPFTVRNALSVKYPKILPGETAQHVIFVTLNDHNIDGESQPRAEKGYMSIAGAPALVIYHGKNGQTYSGSSVVTKDKIPQPLLESVAQKHTGTNGWYWLVFSLLMSVTIVIPLSSVLSFKNRYDEKKRQRTKKVNSDEDETSSEDRSKSKEVAPKQMYIATQVMKKKLRKE